MLLKELCCTLLNVGISTSQMNAFLLGAAVVVLELDLKEIVTGINIRTDTHFLTRKPAVMMVQIHGVEPVIKILGAVL